MDQRVPLQDIIVDGIEVSLAGKPILNGVSMRIEAGERVAILGASGCGKTTLLRTLGGLLRPSSGSIRSGCERPGFVFQDPRLLPWRTALENAVLGIAANTLSPAQRRHTAIDMLLSCGLSRDDLAKYPAALSGGMRARVALARVLLHDPDLLLFDEPFGSLDIGSRHAVQRLTLTMITDRRITMVLVTHDLAEAVNLCNRVIVLTRMGGRVVLDQLVSNGDSLEQSWGHSSATQKTISSILSDNRVREALVFDA